MCDTPLCSTESRPVARRVHHCEICQKDIDKGEQYYKLSGIWPDGPNAVKLHLNCEKLYSFCQQGAEIYDCLSFQDTREALIEIPLDCLGEVWDLIWPELQETITKLDNGRRRIS